MFNLIYLFIVFWGRISLFSSGWPRTCYVDQADRKLKEICQPLSPGILRLLVCTTVPNLFHYLQDYFYYSFICPCAYICCMYAGSCIDKGVLGPLEWSCRHLWAACTEASGREKSGLNCWVIAPVPSTPQLFILKFDITVRTVSS